MIYGLYMDYIWYMGYVWIIYGLYMDSRWIIVYRYTGWWLSRIPSEKYDFVNWDDELPNIRKIKKCFKAPIRYYFTNLNCWAIKGDDSPYIHHHLWVSVVGWGRDQIYADGRCPYANHGPHGPGIWIATFTPFLWPSFVGEFPSTMEHGGWGVWMRSEKSGWSRVKSWQNLWRNFVVF